MVSLQTTLFASLIPGLFIFLYGISHLSHDIQKLVGARFKTLMAKLVSKPWKGTILGAITTSLIQSSTATTVITVSLVHAGILNFQQTLGIILGANIGTTITSQLVALKLTKIAPFFLLVGFLIMVLSKRHKVLGKAIFYFGLVFFGLYLMGEAMGPLKTNGLMNEIIVSLENPFIAILAGAAVTAIVQSSSVTSGIVVLLGTQGLIPLGIGIPLILGANIGTTATTILTSVGLDASARRVAAAHVTFNIVGVLLILPFLTLFETFIQSLGGSVAQQIANGHLIFNLAMALIFLAVIPYYARFITYIIPSREREFTSQPKHLKKEFLKKKSKSFAFLAIRKELANQMGFIKEIYKNVFHILVKGKTKKMNYLRRLETTTDELDDHITDFIIHLAHKGADKKTSKQLIILTEISNRLERLADTGKIIGKMSEKMHFKGLVLPAATKREILLLRKLFNQSLNDLHKSIILPDKRTLQRIKKRYKQMKRLILKYNDENVIRLEENIYTVVTETVYADFLLSMEQANHNIKRIVMGLEKLRK